MREITTHSVLSIGQHKHLLYIHTIIMKQTVAFYESLNVQIPRGLFHVYLTVLSIRGAGPNAMSEHCTLLDSN